LAALESSLPPEELSTSRRGKLGAESRIFYGNSVQSARSGFRISYRRFLGPCLRPLLLSQPAAVFHFPLFRLFRRRAFWLILSWLLFSFFREASGVGSLGIQFLAARCTPWNPGWPELHAPTSGWRKFRLLAAAQPTVAGRHPPRRTNRRSRDAYAPPLSGQAVPHSSKDTVAHRAAVVIRGKIKSRRSSNGLSAIGILGSLPSCPCYLTQWRWPSHGVSACSQAGLSGGAEVCRPWRLLFPLRSSLCSQHSRAPPGFRTWKCQLPQTHSALHCACSEFS